MKLFDLKNAGHWPTLLAAFLYFDFSFMVWTVLGPLGAQIGEKLDLSPEQKGLMVALPIRFLCKISKVYVFVGRMIFARLQAKTAAHISGAVIAFPVSGLRLNCCFLIFSANSMPRIVTAAVSNRLNPSIGLTRCFIRR